MAIIERTRPYETLIRHSENGTVGAHHLTITEVVKDGAVLAATVSAPAPIVGVTALRTLIDAAAAQAIQRAIELDAELRDARAALAELQAANAELTARTAQGAAAINAVQDKLVAEQQAAKTARAAHRNGASAQRGGGNGEER